MARESPPLLLGESPPVPARAGQNGPFELWFRPKPFETERLYERLGALVLKRYVPTGGDLVMRWARRRQPERRWVSMSLESLRVFESRTRVNEAIHLIGFVAFTTLAVRKFATRSLTAVGLTLALAPTLLFGLWPVALQRYNRLRVRRAIEVASGLGARR